MEQDMKQGRNAELYTREQKSIHRRSSQFRVWTIARNSPQCQFSNGRCFFNKYRNPCACQGSWKSSLRHRDGGPAFRFACVLRGGHETIIAIARYERGVLLCSLLPTSYFKPGTGIYEMLKHTIPHRLSFGWGNRFRTPKSFRYSFIYLISRIKKKSVSPTHLLTI
jgi:hypothetical protein